MDTIEGITGGARATSFRSAVLATLAVAVLLAAPAGATDYYACDCDAGAEAGCTPGNDAGAGTSPATAWRTYDRLQGAVATSSCGDTFNFCRGGRFDATGTVEWAVPRDCSLNHTVIQSYQPGSFQNDPVVAADNVTFAFASGGAKGVTLRDVDVVCPTDCDNGVGAVFTNIDDVVLERILVDGFNIGVQVGTERAVTLRNSIVRNNETQGMIGQAGDGTLIEGNLFQNNGCLTGTIDDCGMQHALYFNNLTANNNRRILVRNNTFDSNCIDAFANRRACNGNVVALRGGNGVAVTDNVFITPTSPEALPGCSVVRMAASTDPTQVCTNCEFSRNRIIGGHSLFEFESWVGGVVENNLLYTPATTTITGAKSAISHQASASGAPPSSSPTVRNNSVVVGSSGGGTFPAVAFDLRDDAGTTSVYSNAVRMIGSGPNDVCFRLHSTTGLANLTEDYNLCELRNANAAWASYSARRTLLQYRADSTNGDHSLEADPGFVSPPNDFHLAAGVASVDAGHPSLSSQDDHDGFMRPAGAGYDVGAYELDAAAPPEFPLAPILIN